MLKLVAFFSLNEAFFSLNEATFFKTSLGINSRIMRNVRKLGQQDFLLVICKKTRKFEINNADRADKSPLNSELIAS